jgi:RNA polymerase sigma-70 factor (ECF subfamily)
MRCPSHERETIDRVLAGDTEAFRALVVRYQQPVLAFVGNLLRDRHHAEDVAQDVFLLAFARLGSFDAGRAAFSTWLFTIARNRCLNALSRRSPATTAHPPEPTDPHTPLAGLIRREALDQLDRALDDLPTPQRTAIVLAELVGLDQAEVARIEGVAPGTVRSRISRAKKALTESIRRAAGATE